MKKKKIFRKAMSVLLSFAILMGTLAIAIPVLKVDVSAILAGNETITQTRVVSDYEKTYSNYAAYYLNGAGEATDMVIPGLDPSQDYVVQGLSYYPAKDWMVVTAYHADETYSSKMFCLDAETGEFVGMFSFKNKDGSVNKDHGGGIAFSEHNIYYSCGDKDRKIAYAPLSALDALGTNGVQYIEVQLVDEAEFYEVGSVKNDSKTAYTAYVCYDQGYLWMGNFYDLGAKMIGITIAAADYNCPATDNYNSMVYGYKLQGESSAAEWDYLVNTSYQANCRSYPTHALAINNTLNDIQYAVVDNGKLYLSRSYGSGAGNSINFGFGETSKLTVADIDLSAIPTTNVNISTNSDNSATKTIKAHVINDYEEYNMMPMSEGLCFVNGLIFCTFEGASNKYKNESSGLTSIGNCTKPVDVIWKIDPYALEKRVEVVDTPATHYERVNSLSEIENGEEYIIVYESPVKDPVTQQNILYALDANGGYKDYRLSKNSLGSNVGYTGSIGHAITEYSIEDGMLYLGNAEKDDVKNIRWEISNLSGNAYSIQSPEYYFVNQPNLYFDAANISMSTDNIRGNNIRIQESGDGEGGFWISNNEQYFLWCNDGTTASYNTAYNNYYQNNNSIFMYSGIKEQAGTFHMDALNLSGSNVLGGSIVTGADEYYAHGVFNLYKRIVDKTSSTYESRVYTDMTAELQADGTYTINLETYAISPNHYEYVGDRPTDYIIVMDASTSVTDGQDGTGIYAYNGNLQIASLCAESVTSDDNGTGVVGYAFAQKQLYYQTSDGKYHRLYLAINNVPGDCDKSFVQHYWVYYIGDDGLYYVLLATNENNNVAGGVRAGVDKVTFYSNVDNGTAYSGYSSQKNNTDRRKTNIFNGPHHEFFPGSTGTPLDTSKAKAAELIEEIASQSSDDRIAITYYGASASYLGKNGWLSSGFTDAFWDATTNKDNLKAQVSNISSSGNQTDNSGMEFAFANNIMDNSGVDYTADGNRNCVIVFISDGVPGSYDGNSITTAANNAVANSLKAKNKGAFVYSVIVGGDNPNFDKNNYMAAVSSRYPAAKAINDLGGRNVDGVEYFSTLADCTIDGYVNFNKNISHELVKNNAVGLANLDASSILCEELSTAFKGIVDENGNLKDGIELTYKLVPGSYDKVERFAFNEGSAVDGSTAGVTVSYDASNTHKMLISGYDYSKEYISKGKTGRKLQIVIEGVEANEEADITNTSINNTSSTAIYQNNGEYVAADTFKSFPTEYFNIPTYTYVLDYDLPMYDSDVNGTLCSVDGGLNKQDVYNTVRETDNVALNFVNGNQDMTYELVSGEFNEKDNSSFCLIKRDDGTYDWFRINIVPASNVLFEENRFTASSSGTLAKTNWNTEGAAIATGQSLSGDDDRYGYDSNYANNGDNYSNGTVLKATVNSSTKRSETMTFSYKGTGFDLMAACGANTGVQLVTVKNSEGTIEKVFMVDTYYVDTANYDGALLKQVPIVSYTNEGGYGEYTVEVTAAYLSNAQGVTGGRSSMFNKTYTAQNLLRDMGINVPLNEVEFVWFNDNSILNGGTGPVAEADSANRGTAAAAEVELDCYIDSIRVYNPLGNDSSLYIDSEKGAKYYNIVNELASGKGNVITSGTGLFAYVVGSLAADDEGNIPALSFSNYQSVGPQNEIYLQSATGGADSHAVAFNVTVPNSDSRVMISLRAVDGATTANVASGNNAIEFAINTATEQYFDITPYLDINTSTGVANVVITNNGAGLLSVNNLKLVDATAQAVTSEDLPVMARSLSLRPTRVDPNSYDYDGVSDDIVIDDTQQPEVDTPVDDNTDVEVPAIVENIFTRIIAFFKKLFGFIFSI